MVAFIGIEHFYIPTSCCGAITRSNNIVFYHYFDANNQEWIILIPLVITL